MLGEVESLTARHIIKFTPITNSLTMCFIFRFEKLGGFLLILLMVGTFYLRRFESFLILDFSPFLKYNLFFFGVTGRAVVSG